MLCVSSRKLCAKGAAFEHVTGRGCCKWMQMVYYGAEKWWEKVGSSQHYTTGFTIDMLSNVSGCKDLFGSLGVTESCEPNIDISSPRWCGEIVIQQSRLYTFSRYEQHCHLFGVVFLGTWQITLLWALVLVSGLLKLFVTENSFHCG